MINRPDTRSQRIKRHKRVRAKISGTPERPRLNVFRSETNIYAQIIDDVNGVTLVSASSLEKEFDGKGDNGGLVDHDVIEQPSHGRSNLNAGNLIDVAQRDHDTRDDFGVDASGARGDDLGGARGQNFVVVKQVAQDDGLVDDGATHGYLLPRGPKSNRRFL